MFTIGHSRGTFVTKNESKLKLGCGYHKDWLQKCTTWHLT